MKKFNPNKAILSLFFSLIIFWTFTLSAYSAGRAGPKRVLKLIPEEVKAIFVIDIHKAMETDLIKNLLEQEKENKEFLQFMEKTGIDPQEDIYYIAAAVTGTTEEAVKKGVIIINLDYDKETLLSLLKKEAEEELKEEDYDGITIYTVDNNGKSKAGAFLDSSHIIAGSEKEVKRVIDTYRKNASNILENKEMSNLLKHTNTRAIVWGVTLLPATSGVKIPERFEPLRFLQVLESATFYFDYRKDNLISEIRIFSKDQEKNQKIMDMLQGAKAFASLSASEEPVINEFLDRIEISSQADFIQVYTKIPSELLDRIKSTPWREKLRKENY
ncbi:MAG: DUF3352 domain-containing protein [Candidatus Aminicenantales bacterium]